jgi:hypothetical protein
MGAALVGLSHSPLIGKNDPAPEVLARKGFQLMIDGELTGKLVIHPTAQD